MTPRHGIVLFGHGSRDPLWRQPLEATAARIARHAPDVAVRCAYLELNAPDLPTATAELASAGVEAITVIPMFLGMGKHAREDLPLLMEQLRTRHGSIAFTLRPAVGEDPRVLDLLARIAQE